MIEKLTQPGEDKGRLPKEREKRILGRGINIVGH